jgi:hypothetical protein
MRKGQAIQGTAPPFLDCPSKPGKVNLTSAATQTGVPRWSLHERLCSSYAAPINHRLDWQSKQ